MKSLVELLFFINNSFPATKNLLKIIVDGDYKLFNKENVKLILVKFKRNCQSEN